MKKGRSVLRVIHFILIITISFAYVFSSQTDENCKKDSVLTVAVDKFGGTFNPLYARSASDISLCGICNELLLDYDREGQIILNGKSGETRPYDGTDYTYYGISDCVIKPNGEYYDYNFELREDVYFGDGVNLTADDVIFTMYVMADPSYTGVEQFYTLPVCGMEDYRLGFSKNDIVKYYDMADKIYSCGRNGYKSEFAEIDQDTFDMYWNCLDTAWKNSMKLIADYCAENFPAELAKFGNNSIALAMYGWSYCSYDEVDGLEGLATGKTWSLKSDDFPDENDFFDETMAVYKNDAELFYNKALTNLTDESVSDAAKRLFAESMSVKAPDKSKVYNISGITKTGKYSFTIKMADSAVLNLYKLSFSVLPLHYYGDNSLFDIENNRFGFEKGNLEKIKSLNSKPLGAGPYVFEDFSDGIIRLKRNEKYYKGMPKTENVSLCEITSGDAVNSVIKGTVDIATVGYGAADINKISSVNSDGKLSGDRIFSIETQIQSYGYIGINASRVKVGNDASGYESKSLRKAFATLFSVYRDLAVSSFFYSESGCMADVIDYPIPPSSWASPNVTDPDYRRAFSYNKDDEFIYKNIQSDNERYLVALDAAVEFFIEAGYEYDNVGGVFTSAPQGASLKYTIVIPSGGTKAHPGYIIASRTSEALKSVGITLDVIDLANTGSIWNSLLESEYDMWSATRSRGADPDLYQIYHSDSVPGAGGTEYNYNFLEDKRLDELIEEAALSDNNSYRKQLYGECFAIISDWGVEIPVFVAKTLSIFNADKVEVESVIKNATSFRNWSDEIETIKLK